jgi:hypothetical protein
MRRAPRPARTRQDTQPLERGRDDKISDCAPPHAPPRLSSGCRLVKAFTMERQNGFPVSILEVRRKQPDEQSQQPIRSRHARVGVMMR